MREVTSEYLSQVKSGARQFGFYVNVYGNAAEPDTLWLGDIISVDIVRAASDQLQIGACMSDKLTLQTKATTLFNGRGKKVVVYYRCTAPILGWVKLGTFYVDECVTERGVTAVTAYDMMSRLDKRMTWTGDTAPTFPCTMQAMLDFICTRAGVTTDFTCQSITIERAPDGYTARELISYIAASHGGNARFSPSEVLQIRPYTQTSEVIKYGECYSMNVASDSGYTVKGILFDRGGDDKIYIDGTPSEYDDGADGVVQAYNPFATVGIAEYAWNQLGGLSYSAVSLEMPAANVLEPGDVFTIQTSDGSEKTAIVMEQTLSVSCTGGFVESISCTAESKNQTRNAENRAEATEKAVSSGGLIPLTEYEYLTDLSAKCNGVTYTAEKDADTGLISKISDSNGNEFEPTINSGIADVTLHNAVFWAVAMARGTGKSIGVLMPDMSGIVGYFVPENADVNNNVWKNSVLSGNDIVLTNVTKSGNVLKFTPDSYGIYTVDEPDTIYAIVRLKSSTAENVWNQVISKSTTQIADRYEFNLTAHLNYMDTTTAGNDVHLNDDNTIFGVYAYTRDTDGIVKGYFNGNYMGVPPKSSIRGRYNGKMGLNKSLRETGTIDPTTDLEFIMCAFGTTFHDEATVQKNMAYLANKYLAAVH